MAPLDDIGEKVAPLLAGFLPLQRWYTGDEPPTRVGVTVLDLRPGVPLFAWLLVDVTTAEGTGATYQLALGGRPVESEPDFLHGKARATVGVVDDVVFYDALVDPDLALLVFAIVAPDEEAKVARPLLVEQSNTSVVYDERFILKFFRRISDGPNLDVEMTKALFDRGFPHVVPQLEPHRRDDGSDLAVVRQYLLGATDAWDLAHTSLRVSLSSPLPDSETGAAFGAEAATLGDVTARLHLALADAYGVEDGAPDEWLASFHAQLDRLAHHPPANPGATGGPRIAPGDVVDVAGVGALLDALADVEAPGAAIRGHGDLHLGQFLLADTGWYVIDFEGEPARPVAERTRPSSPLRDVAGMVRSFQYAARTALVERGRDIDDKIVAMADDWEERAVAAFWRGYTAVEGIDALLPDSEADQRKLLRAFELDKAVYEVIYELGHRPDWVDVPASAIRRALAPVA